MLKTKLNNKSRYPRVVIAGNHGSAGKTIIATGLCAALTRKGFSVQPFKKGPDFIDPMWLTAASGNRICRNLDFFMMEDYILQTFQNASLNADISIIEGNKGLHDGLDTEGSNSTAAMARMLQAPVILIIDARKMTRGIAPLLMGYLNFEPDVRVAGVILNRVAGSRHEAKLRAAIERYCDIEVLGSIPRCEELEIDERHLGLIPVKEHLGASCVIDKIAEIIEKNVDLEKIVEISRSVPELPLSNLKYRNFNVSLFIAPQAQIQKSVKTAIVRQAHYKMDGSFRNFEKVSQGWPNLSEPSETNKCNAGFNQNKVRIGVAIDRAFTFYYQENLEALRTAGAELIPFSPLKDSHLPEVDGLYIGGGFPEMFLKELEKNWSLKEEIRTAILNDMPVYAECGGLMYLAKNISWNGQTREMVGGLPCDIEITSRPQGRGYMILRTESSSHMTEKQMGLLDKSNMKWNLPLGKTIRAHEFHYSRITNYTEKVSFAYKVERGYGIDGQNDGLIFHNVLASYAHLHSYAAPWWAPEFVGLVSQSLPALVEVGIVG